MVWLVSMALCRVIVGLAIFYEQHAAIWLFYRSSCLVVNIDSI
ncbi:hypothetical protein BIFGAL_03164 [Bifidobacterium gallicum DSM 20093 = LMG 11596]|uniref:Uncharacterized protein n=1 Tax=Bifidobacterium gallicum DSM 20093 = LMG 11596 TaxID=561180 RepID=D1NTK6_9BIFI|nr:hypothetical protein BIFGAL_03164 [Bifidobacterium gallicum DSM 20093 = LMG 11596]